MKSATYYVSLVDVLSFEILQAVFTDVQKIQSKIYFLLSASQERVKHL